MPIYEFFCENCNTIYKFFSRTVNTEKIPACPHCDNEKLERRVSLFAVLSGKKDDSSGEDDMPPIDETKMEQAMAMLAKEADKIDENDPRQAAQFMRRLSDMAGIKMGPTMEEALHRMEKGEDPEKIEEEMGDLLEEDEPFLFEAKKMMKGIRKPKPRVDDTLYDL
ncbi:MAG: zinc ribbon domain-containing protein [Calditrichia bacterium]